MEVLIRMLCSCSTATGQAGCRTCAGKGYVERWVTLDLLKGMRGWVILDRRHVPLDASDRPSQPS